MSTGQVKFDDCISAFRMEKDFSSRKSDIKHCSYILTPFCLSMEWDIGICKIKPSIPVTLPGVYSAFISQVDNPPWIKTSNPHLFGIALSSVISFITKLPCKAPKEPTLCYRLELSDEQKNRLAILHPVLSAGPGSTFPIIAKKSLEVMCCEVKELIDQLFKVDYKIYRSCMQYIRMAHLSIINRGEDFGLGYMMIVAAIETIAKQAIKKEDMETFEDFKDFQKRENDDEFNKLLNKLKELNSKNQYLKERWVHFVKEFAPVSNWEEYVESPWQKYVNFFNDIGFPEHYEDLTQQSVHEYYPKDLKTEEIDEILGSAYKHRSAFIHSGKQPPHLDVGLGHTRFFQECVIYNGQKAELLLLPNFELLLGIAKHSLFNWLAQLN